jgi:tetratricopeptide (TPR) repeat protein
MQSLITEERMKNLHQSKLWNHEEQENRKERILDLYWKYPELQQDEEQVRKSPYDVMSWYHYLEHIDDFCVTNTYVVATNITATAKATTTSTISQSSISASSTNTKKKITKQEEKILNSFRIWIGQRAVQQLPNSYKLWKTHLDFLKRMLKEQYYYYNHDTMKFSTDVTLSLSATITTTSLITSQIQCIIQIYEQCLQETTRMPKMPRLWKDYLQWYQSYPETMENITQWRHILHRALQALPVTQHASLWTQVILPLLERQQPNFSNKNDNDGTVCTISNLSFTTIPYLPSETVLRLLRRYCTLDPSYRTRMAKICLQLNRPAEAAQLYYQVLNDCEYSYTAPTSTTLHATTTETTIMTRYDLWMAFSDVICRYPLECQNSGMDISFEILIRAVLQQQQLPKEFSSASSKDNHEEQIHNHPTKDSPEPKTSKVIQFHVGEMEGILWAKLATYFIRLGNFDMARSIYEEGMEAVSRVRDFSILYDAYSQLEEGILEALMLNQPDEDEEEEKGEEKKDTKTEQVHNLTSIDSQVSKKEDPESVNDCHKEYTDVNKEDEEDWDILVGPSQTSDSFSASVKNVGADLEWALARAEYLTARRPLLLNRVLLRQNPHNVSEWLTRAKLYTQQGQLTKAIATLQESFQRVQSNQAIQGSPSQLVLELVRLYEEVMGDVDKARMLLRQLCHEQYYCNTKGDKNSNTNGADNNDDDDDDDDNGNHVDDKKQKASKAERYSYHFHRADDLAKCHVGWIELELRHEQWDEALSLARQAVAGRTSSSLLPAKVAQGLVRSPQLWDLLLDLEESLGTVATTRDSYHRAMELQVATPLHILNFCSYLKDRKYWEESFAAYERGLAMFRFPASKVLWMSYLQSFLERYGGTQIERVRDLFDRCLEDCPPEDCSEFFLLQGDFEETHGLTRRALGVYRTMCQRVPPSETLRAYRLFVAKTSQYLGIPATRSVYEDAIAALKDDHDTAQICLDFAQMESSLREIERARAIYSYGASMADPRQDPKYWKAWHDFEVSNGNEMTFRDMLRVKRSVQASFATTTIHHPYSMTGEDGQLTTTSTSTTTAPAAAVSLLDDVPMDPEQAVRQLAEQEGVEWEEDVSSQLVFQPTKITPATTAPIFVPPSRPKRTRADMLQDMEDQVSKLRHVATYTTDTNDDYKNQNMEHEEIDIDNLSDDDDDNDTDNTSSQKNQVVVSHLDETSNHHATWKSSPIQSILTKEIPAAVFGGLIPCNTDTNSMTTTSKS